MPSFQKMHSVDYAAKFGARWHKLHEATAVERSLPVRFGSVDINIAALAAGTFPEMGVLELRNGSAFDPGGWVLAEEGVQLPDHSWFADAWERMTIPELRRPPLVLPGVVLNLASDFVDGNWGHFLLDLVPRVQLFRKAGFTWNDVDTIHLSPPLTPNRSRILEKLGVPLDRCVVAQPGQTVKADCLLATSFPGRARNYPSWAAEFLRTEFGVPLPKPQRRLYIARNSSRRRLINEAEIWPVLERFGFESIDCARRPAIFRDFSEAEVVIGPHGAGLSHLAACGPKTKVLEIVPSDHVYPYYYTLSDSAGLNYGYLVGSSSHRRPAGSWGPSPYDFRVDPEELEEAVRSMVN